MKTPEQLAEEKYPINPGDELIDFAMLDRRTIQKDRQECWLDGYATRSQEAQEMEVWVEVTQHEGIATKNTVWVVPSNRGQIWLEKRIIKVIK